MNKLKFVLLVLWIAIGTWISLEYGLLPMALYYIGCLCFFVSKIIEHDI